MNKSVPTLLGIVIILLVVLLVVVTYQYRLTQKLSEGERVVGTVGGELLTGVETPDEEIGVSEVLGSREPESEAKSIPPEAIEHRAERQDQRRERQEEMAEPTSDE